MPKPKPTLPKQGPILKLAAHNVDELIKVLESLPKEAFLYSADETFDNQIIVWQGPNVLAYIHLTGY